MELKEWIDAAGQVAVSITGLAAAVTALVIANRQSAEVRAQQNARYVVYMRAIINTIQFGPDPIFWLKVKVDRENMIKKILPICKEAISGIINLRNALGVFDVVNLPSVEAVDGFIIILKAIERVEVDLKNFENHLTELLKSSPVSFVKPDFSSYNSEIKAAIATLEHEVERLAHGSERKAVFTSAASS